MATSDSSSSPSSSGTDFADPNPSSDPDTSSDRVQSLLESLNLSQPSEVSDGSHTDFTGDDDDDDDDEEEVVPANGSSVREEEVVVEMEAGEEPPSPTSSGYDGERGSSGGEGGEIREGNADEAAWLPGKRHVEEDDGSMSWRKRKKHFFILSHSGKPIYSSRQDTYREESCEDVLSSLRFLDFNGNMGVVKCPLLLLKAMETEPLRRERLD